MPEPITIYTRENVSENDLKTLCEQLGGGVLPDGGILPLYISDQNKYIWLGISDSILENFGSDEELLEEHQLIEQKLKGRPVTSVIVEINSEPGSKQLAYKFAIEFAHKWNAVIEDSLNGIYSAKELFELEKVA